CARSGFGKGGYAMDYW
nr:immunoglobulin heavy chain junction region [Mus musculus]